MNPPFVVVVGGGTASGKTTLARLLAARFGALLIAQDRYYHTADDPKHHNFDHPDALENTLLVDHLRALVGGRAVELPVYHFDTHSRAANTHRVEPAELIVVEGILTLVHPELRALASLRVFVHASADVRLARRVRRDVVERGRSADGVLQQYLDTVRPMHFEHVEPSRVHADLVLDGEAPLDDMVHDLICAIAARGGPVTVH